MPKETLLVHTLVELADSLVDDFDVVELLSLLAHRCVEVLDVSAAGVMLVAPEGDLRIIASSSEGMRIVELFELQNEEGPCLDCFRSGEVIAHEDLTTAGDLWPRLVPVAMAAGFRSVQALPMRLRGSIIGALNLFGSNQGALGAADLAAGQALADVATIAILQQRVISESRVLNDQLNNALTSRVVIEQAKGVLAERADCSMEAAFERMRRHARNHNLLLADVARRVVDKSLPESALDPAPPASTRPARVAPAGGTRSVPA